MSVAKKIYELFLKSSGVSTDTRKIFDNCIFFALKGNNFNGNTFALEAIKQGALYAVIDEPTIENNERLILVENVLKTLQEVANIHRRTFNIPFIAITGSNGKTTTKELIYAVLKQKFNAFATQGNLNNHIGIPLTLLSIKQDTEIAIIEMGANHQKEIESYCQYVEPTHGLITNIGKAHLEGFGGIEGVKKGKGELYNYLYAHQGIIFLCTTNDTLVGMSKFTNPITYPLKNNFYSCDFVEAMPYIKLRAENNELISTQLAGAYNFDNIAVALCIGKYFGVDDFLANKAIAMYNPDNNRSQIIKTNSNSIVMDCYNANPTSMKAALESFAQNDFGPKMILIGDMYELGAESELEHKNIGVLISQLKFEKVLLCGTAMKAAFDELGDKAEYFENRALLLDWLKNNYIQHYHILIKASRGMALEKLVEYL
jgi:UDP-N-acetylmuramoyl-tripeptide--D-alanyl-D-alanine ligase